MIKKIILNGAIAILLLVNVVNMFLSGVNLLNTTAVIVCIICLAMNFVDRLRDDD